MKQLFLFFVSTLFIASCSTTRAPSDRMLDARSQYESDKPLEVTFAPSDEKIIPKRSAAVVADIWIHPNEMATGDYFLGGWIRSVIKEPHWTIGGGIEKAFKAVTKPDPKKKDDTSWHPERSHGKH